MKGVRDPSKTRLELFHLDHLRIRTTATVVNLVAAVFLVCCANGSIYLHGLPPAIAPSQQTHIPMTFWASPDFFTAKTIDPVLLTASRDKPYSHENLFHSLLGLFDVQTAFYQPSLDLFSAARK